MIEESEVDPKKQTMVTRTKNLNHVRIMQIIETQTFQPGKEGENTTTCKSEACIVSRFGWGMTGKIEMFGQSNFAANASKVKISKKKKIIIDVTLFYSHCLLYN